MNVSWYIYKRIPQGGVSLAQLTRTPLKSLRSAVRISFSNFFMIWFDSSKIYLVHEKKLAFLQKWTKMDKTKTLHSCIRFENFIAHFKGYDNIYRLIQILFKNETTVKSYVNSKEKIMYIPFLFVERFHIVHLTKLLFLVGSFLKVKYL